MWAMTRTGVEEFDPEWGPIERALDELRASLGDRVVTAPSVREHHGRDESPLPSASPDAVVFATSMKEVAHGIGLRKVDFLIQELPEGVEVMRAIKRALDPNGILNPGKVIAS